MGEQRKEERKKLMSFTPVYEMHTRIPLGYLGDLTPQGAMIVSEAAQEIDKRMSLAIEFHETPVTPATRMVIPIRVAWCKREEGSSFHHVGVEFLELTNESILVIKAILERYQFRREMPPDTTPLSG